MTSKVEKWSNSVNGYTLYSWIRIESFRRPGRSKTEKEESKTYRPRIFSLDDGQSTLEIFFVNRNIFVSTSTHSSGSNVQSQTVQISDIQFEPEKYFILFYLLIFFFLSNFQ